MFLRKILEFDFQYHLLTETETVPSEGLPSILSVPSEGVARMTVRPPISVLEF